MRSARPPPSPRRVLVTYFGLAFGISWSAWIAAGLLAGRFGGALDLLLLYAGIPGPLLAALWLLHRHAPAAERRDFYHRIYQVERLAPRWLLLVLLLYPVLTALAVALDWLAGGVPPDAGRLARRLGDPALLLGSVALLVLLGPLPEEPGWRGYALDRLQAWIGALWASLALGVLWALWHLPLFYVPGTYQHGLTAGSQAFWLFNLTALCSSVLMTWIYNHSARSIFGAILFHAVLNVTRDSLPLDDRTELIRAGLLLAFTLGVIWRCGARRLSDCH